MKYRQDGPVARRREALAARVDAGAPARFRLCLHRRERRPPRDRPQQQRQGAARQLGKIILMS